MPALVGVWEGFGIWSSWISWKLSKETLLKEELGRVGREAHKDLQDLVASLDLGWFFF